MPFCTQCGHSNADDATAADGLLDASAYQASLDS